MFQKKCAIGSEQYFAGAALGSRRMDERARCRGTSREVRGLMPLKGDKDQHGAGRRWGRKELGSFESRFRGRPRGLGGSRAAGRMMTSVMG